MTNENTSTGYMSKLMKGIQSGRAAVDEAKARLAVVRSRIDELDAEATALQSAPASKDDFLSALDAWIDQCAAAGRTNVANTLHRHLSMGLYKHGYTLLGDHSFRLDNIRSGVTMKGQGAELLAAAPVFATDRSFKGLFNEVSLCMLFGDQIKEAMRRTMESFEWPYPAASSSASRDLRMREIDAEVRQLQEEASELASMVGIIYEPPQRPRQKSLDEVGQEHARERQAAANAIDSMTRVLK